MGVSSIFVKDDRFADVEMEEVVSETTRRKAVSALADSIQFIQEDKKMDGKSISDVVDKMIEEVMSNSDVLFHLTDIRTFQADDDDFLFNEVDLAKETTTFITKVFS